MLGMNVLICDDTHDHGLELAIKSSVPYTRCHYFDRPSDALSHIKRGARVDVCFLGIIMLEMNGIELARKIRKMEIDKKAEAREIVFVSDSNEYAVESFEVKAFSYLLKPPEPARVRNVLQEITNIKKAKDIAGITISTKSMTRFLYFRDISFIEVINYKVYFHLIDGSVTTVNSTLGALLPKILEDKRFGQCHRSFVVNMNAAKIIQDNIVTMHSGEKIPISRRYAGFRNEYIECLR